MKKLIILMLCLIPILAQAEEHRSTKEKDDFKKMNPCPTTGESKGACPDWVIDHIIPLACGGEDSPNNMQWQTVTDGKAKDSWERKNCTQKHSSTQSNYSSNRSYYIGSHGGCFTYSETGKKHYVNRYLCN